MGDSKANLPQPAGVENVLDPKGSLLALIIRASFSPPGVNFVTPDDLSQQVGCLRHPAGKIIEPHVHNLVPRQVQLTQEVLFLRKGKMRVDFYDDDRTYLFSSLLGPGDTILLVRGGHGFEVLEDVDMLEVKQGPYVGMEDKTRFKAAPPEPPRWLEAGN